MGHRAGGSGDLNDLSDDVLSFYIISSLKYRQYNAYISDNFNEKYPFYVLKGWAIFHTWDIL